MSSSSNIKKKQILKTAKELFWKFGFRRVTIEEISREAGVSKMTFYKHYSNKLELATTMLDDLFKESMNKIHQISINDDKPPQKLKSILQLKSDGIEGLSEEFLKDLYSNPDSELKSYMEQKTSELINEMISFFEKGKQDGWIRKDLNVPFLFNFVMASMDSLTNDKVLKQFSSTEDMIIELTTLFVYGMSPHD